LTAEWDYDDGPPAWRKWLARLLALLALAAVIGGLYAIYQAAIAEDEPEVTAISDELDTLSAAADRLGTRLEAFKKDTNPARAEKVAARALSATRAAGKAYRESDLPDTNAGARIKNGLGAEFEYLSAVVEVLDKPTSRIVESLPDRATRARRALEAMPDDHGLPETVRGVDRLRAWARAND
jgi:hypothetical protein